MTNDEIRIKIAKLCGYNWYEINKEATLCNVSYAGILPKGREVVDHPSEGSKLYFICPNWPESIADAWELVEEMRANHFSIKLMAWDHTDKWVVIMHHRQGHDEKIPDDEIESDTAPLAICLAYIAWKEATND